MTVYNPLQHIDMVMKEIDCRGLVQPDFLMKLVF